MCRSVRNSKEGGDAPGGTTAETVHRVVMWGPPRSLSTTVERSIIEAKKVHVLHEPFGVPFYWSSEAASSREAGERSNETYESVAHSIFTAAPPEGKRFIFSKNLSYYFSPHCIPKLSKLLGGDYSKVHHSFMIRHPAKAISSLYFKSCVDNEKTGYTHFDPVEAGYASMNDLFVHLEAQPGCPPLVIIDADDLLEDPEGIMRAYCHALGLPFDTSMLNWEAGIEHCPELRSPWSGWTDDVINSSGITRRAKRSAAPDPSSLPIEVQETIAEAMPIYDKMFARRVLPCADGERVRTADMQPSQQGAANDDHLSSIARRDKEATSDAATGPCGCAPEPAKLTGMLLLVVSVLIWVCQAELLQTIHNDAWSKPYFQAASLKSCWVLMLPVWAVLSKLNASWQDEITFRRPLQPTLKVIGLSLGLMILVQASSATWIASLGLTSVSVNSAIYNINPLLVYVFSIPILHERPSVTKSSAVLLAMLGTSVVTLGSTDIFFSRLEGSTEGALMGNGLVVISAGLFALKEVLFKKYFASVSISLTPLTDALLVVGLIGLGSTVTLVPLTFLMDFFGLETFEMPSSDLAQSYGLVALLMASYQACLLAAIALTTPTFVAMGTMLAVPGSIAFDFLLKGYLVPFIGLFGIAMIVVAFALLVLAGTIDELLGYARRRVLRSCESANGTTTTTTPKSMGAPSVLI